MHALMLLCTDPTYVADWVQQQLKLARCQVLQETGHSKTVKRHRQKAYITY